MLWLLHLVIFSVFDSSKTTGSRLKEEAATLCQLRHDNIVSFVGILWAEPKFGIALTLAQYGAMNDFLAEHHVSVKLKVKII